MLSFVKLVNREVFMNGQDVSSFRHLVLMRVQSLFWMPLLPWKPSCTQVLASLLILEVMVNSHTCYMM